VLTGPTGLTSTGPHSFAAQMFVDAFQAAIMAGKGECVRGSPLAKRLDRLCFESGALLENMPARKVETFEAPCARASSAITLLTGEECKCCRRAALHRIHFAPLQKVPLPPSCFRSDQQHTGTLPSSNCLAACCCSAPCSEILKHIAHQQQSQQAAFGHEHTRLARSLQQLNRI
jgi:hypothetical protein